MNYYNEIDDYAATWVENLIHAKLVPPGKVDRRSIVDVQPDDLVGFTQCHFFCGIAGWSQALKLAQWPEDREVWTGSPPCQPFSQAGKQLAHADDRHLWPHLFRLLRARRPAAFFGEQVAAAIGLDWLDRVFDDLEGIGYACRPFVLPACAVNAPHRRDRLYFVGHDTHTCDLDHSHDARLEGQPRHEDYPTGWTFEGRSVAETSDGGDDPDHDAADADGLGAQIPSPRKQPAKQVVSCDLDTHRPWSSTTYIIGHDGKARRVEPSIPLLADGVPARVGKLRSFGNAIVPPLAAEVIRAYMETQP